MGGEGQGGEGERRERGEKGEEVVREGGGDGERRKRERDEGVSMGQSGWGSGVRWRM